MKGENSRCRAILLTLGITTTLIGGAILWKITERGDSPRRELDLFLRPYGYRTGPEDPRSLLASPLKLRTPCAREIRRAEAIFTPERGWGHRGGEFLWKPSPNLYARLLAHLGRPLAPSLDASVSLRPSRGPLTEDVTRWETGTYPDGSTPYDDALSVFESTHLQIFTDVHVDGHGFGLSPLNPEPKPLPAPSEGR